MGRVIGSAIGAVWGRGVQSAPSVVSGAELWSQLPLANGLI